jgi:molybdenum cofactor biosynthesis enzyme
MSSFSDVPPVVTIHCIPMCLPISLTMADVWSASSRVGIKIKTITGTNNKERMEGIKS